jgi:hypothetical protein
VNLKKYTNFNYSNYKKSNCQIFYPRNDNDIFTIIDFATKNNKKILPIGACLSWYDTIFNSNQILIDLSNFKKSFFFDKTNGTLLISPSYKIYEVTKKINKYGWSLYSIPGAPNATIGGCIGNDVHGKDSYKFGNFGSNIIYIELILPNKKKIKCSKKKNEKIFRAVIGGLGLIGVVVNIQLKLKKISKYYKTDNFICNSYKELIYNIYKDKNKYDYINGWIDIHSTKTIARGVIFKSKKVDEQKLIKKNNVNTLAIANFFQKIIFGFCIRNNLIKFINFFIFYLFKFKKSNYNSYKDVTYPLSSYGVDIREIIEPRSFFEIQVILKKNNLPKSLKDFILKCKKLKLSGFVTGIKMHKTSKNYLSFSDNGISININQIFDSNKNFNEIYNKIKILHRYVIMKKYKIYLCKDFFLNKKEIKINYINYNKFLSVKKKVDKKELFYSDFYKRIS